MSGRGFGRPVLQGTREKILHVTRNGLQGSEVYRNFILVDEDFFQANGLTKGGKNGILCFSLLGVHRIKKTY